MKRRLRSQTSNREAEGQGQAGTKVTQGLLFPPGLLPHSLVAIQWTVLLIGGINNPSLCPITVLRHPVSTTAPFRPPCGLDGAENGIKHVTGRAYHGIKRIHVTKSMEIAHGDTELVGDLTGNVSGRCPECGSDVRSARF